MKKETIIAGVLGMSMLAIIGGVGLAIWHASNTQTAKKAVTKTVASNNIQTSEGSSLSVGDNGGLGAGIDMGQGQTLGDSTGGTPTGGTSGNTKPQQKEDFSQYEKYKDKTEAMFGEIKAGTGKEAVANKKVAIYYTGRFTSGQIFDQTKPEKVGQQPKPLVYTPGKHEVVLGLEQGTVGMKVGGKRRVIVPPAVGYGKDGRDPIPPNTLMIFDIELLEVE